MSDSWRVLKGLLNTGDADAMAAAVAERQFLAAVDHPNIVRIYNFVQHTDPRSGETRRVHRDGVRGRPLAPADPARRAEELSRSVPVEHALAYAIEVLRALGYLHSRGLVYCDFKPDNVIQSEEMLKLIDMGGVRRIDDEDSPIYGTVGYQAPEIATDGPPRPPTCTRSGARWPVLTFEFTGYTGTYEHTLPDPGHRAAARAAGVVLPAAAPGHQPDPGRRFASAGDMAEQLTGVLREVLAAGDGNPGLRSPRCSAPSCRRLAPRPARWTAAAGPRPVTRAAAGRADRGGAAGAPGGHRRPCRLLPGHAGHAGSGAADGRAVRRRPRRSRGRRPQVAESAETRLALARALIVTGELGRRREHSGRAGRRDTATGGPPGTRGCASWPPTSPGTHRPRSTRSTTRSRRARAPAGAGVRRRGGGDQTAAARYFGRVWTVDRSYVSAAFGLARARLAADDRAGAVAALAAVPPTSSHHVAAQVAAVRIHLTRDWPVRGRLRRPAGSARSGWTA